MGESTLIAHGISEINAVDLNILNAPGAELKEAFRPQGMVWASLGITDSLTVEAFYQYDWQPIWVPTPGSIFATNDFAGFGGYAQNAQLGFNANPDINLDFVMQEYELLAGMIASGQTIPTAQLVSMGLAYPTKVTLVQDEQEPVTVGNTVLSWVIMHLHSARPNLGSIL